MIDIFGIRKVSELKKKMNKIFKFKLFNHHTNFSSICRYYKLEYV